MRACNDRRRRGNVVVAAAVSLVTLLACVSLSVDGGMLQDKRRHVQAASDAAAMAAAGDLYYNWAIEKGADVNGTARALALETAKRNGFEHGVNGTTVEVSIPPTSGPNVGKKAYAEVIIKCDHARYFSKIFGSTEPVPIRARAVGRGRKSTNGNAILCLDPDDKSALNAGGNGTIGVTGSNVQVNSNNTEAAITNGNGTFGSPTLNVTGGFTGGGFVGPINTGTEPIPDPLAYLPPPDPSKMQVQSTKKWQKTHNHWTLKPGLYYGGVSITSDASVFLEPGIYYMKGGGFSWSGKGSLVGYEVMIYNDPLSNSDVIDLTGQGNCVLTPMKTGPYQGITIWQRRDSTNTIKITGSDAIDPATGVDAKMDIKGTFYAAGGSLDISGNGSGDFIGSQYIADTMIVMGNGQFSIDWTPVDTPGIRDVALVE